MLTERLFECQAGMEHLDGWSALGVSVPRTSTQWLIRSRLGGSAGVSRASGGINCSKEVETLNKRIIVALAGALIGVVLTSSPAAAMWWGANAFTGTVGAVAGPVRPEAICRYNAAGSLKSITIKAPIVHGSHDELTSVGWQYEIRRGVPFHRGELIYRSHTWKTQASTTVASAFDKKTYYVLRDQPGTTLYYLRIVILWYAPGSATTVEGRGVVGYDGYLLKRPAESRDGLNAACPFDYSYTETG